MAVEHGSPVPQPVESSLHATCVPVHVPERTESTVSNVVAAPHVWIVAAPETVGVQRNTCSGALAVAAAQLALSALAPLVVPVNVPPAAGMAIGFAHVPTGMVVLVVEDGARLVLVVGGGGAEVLVLAVGTVVVVVPEPPASARKLDALIVPRPVTRSYPGPAV